MKAGLGQRLQILRQRSGLSIRKLAELAGVTAGMVSCIEREKNSPSVTMLQKLLAALGTTLAEFFSGDENQSEGNIFLRERMKTVADNERSYTLVFPKWDDIHIEMLDETIYTSAKKPPFETLECDIAAYVISGEITLEIEGKPTRTLRPGDAFYIPQGHKHRGYAHGDGPVRLITAYTPARY